MAPTMGVRVGSGPPRQSIGSQPCSVKQPADPASRKIRAKSWALGSKPDRIVTIDSSPLPGSIAHHLRATALTFLVFVSGCTSLPRLALPTAGPTMDQIAPVPPAANGIPVPLVDLTLTVANQQRSLGRRALFSEVWAGSQPEVGTAGPGDFLEVSIWEAPPATLFSGGSVDLRAPNTGSRVVTIPEQMIDAEGVINVPFVGAVKVSGRSQAMIESEIVQRLRGLAHKPQVLVRVTRNVTRNVTIVGEVAQSLRMPLTAKGERLLDALAAAGGVRQPVAKMTLQLTRDSRVHGLPLDTIISDPLQNIALRPGDVITAIHQPFSLSVLGATAQNAELNFETQGISLAQAIARAGGLQDARADPRGVFVFRYEPSQAVPTPVVYRLDLSQPGAFLIAQTFPMQHRDVMYVANAPAAELQKFLNLIGSTIIPAAAVRTLAP